MQRPRWLGSALDPALAWEARGAWPVPLCTGDTQHGVLIQEMRHFRASAALFLPFSLLGLVLVIGNLELL